MRSAVLTAARHAASLLVPPRCALCGRPAAAVEPACARCVAALARVRPLGLVVAGVGPVHAAGAHQGIVRDLVSALKFSGRLGLAGLAAETVSRHLGQPLAAAIVAVPPAPSRLRARGFDPAALIAGALAGRLGLPLVPCLERLDSTRQVGRDRGERVFDPPRVRARGAPAGALLVDDVLTTGATLRACARALERAGPPPLGAAVLARA